MLNYVAILKLLKKHDKHCATQLYPVIERILVSQPFVQALLSSPLFYGRGQPDVAAEGADADCEPASMAMCAICLEPRTHLQQLSCSHEFCMVCLAKASAAELHACPVCRSPQSLHPVDISLGQVRAPARNACEHAGKQRLASAISPPPPLNPTTPPSDAQLNLSLKYHPRLHQPAAPSTRRTASIQSKSPTKATKTLAPHRRAGPVSTEQAGAILCTVHERPSEADEEADAPRTLPPSVLAEEPALADNAHILRRAVALEPLRALLAAGKRMAHMAVAALPCFRVRDAVRLSFSVLTLSLAGWLCVSGAGSGSSADGLDGLTADECAFSAHASGVHGQMLGYDGKTSVSVFSPGL